MVKENQIRDNLAKNLKCISSDLTLIDTEFELPNSLGSSGFIDILAKDKFGNFVVIELKRSNQAARQAIHEINKYVALLIQNHRFPKHKIRCLIISTEWHELLIPFSEFSLNSSYPVQGYKIEVNSLGDVTHIEEVEPVQPQPTFKICRENVICSFNNKEKMEEVLSACVNYLDEFAPLNYFVILMGAREINPNIYFPFAFYIAIGETTHEQKVEIIKKFNAKFKESFIEGLEDEVFEDEPNFIETSILSHLPLYVKNIDNFDTGYPEKLMSLLENFGAYKIHRSATIIEVVKLLSDEELIKMAAGVEGENFYFYYGFSNPKNKFHWDETLVAARNTLLGNQQWEKSLNWYCNKIQSLNQTADTSISIFNPANILGSLYKVITTGSSKFLPSMEATTVFANGSQSMQILGSIEFSSKLIDTTPKELVEKYFHDEFNYFLAMHQGLVWEYESDLLNELGLECITRFISSENDDPKLFRDVPASQNQDLVDINPHAIGLGAYLKLNKKFFMRLRTFFKDNSYGL